MYQFKSATPGLLPVMVFIYGGAFTIGDNKAGQYGPHYLLDKDIVLVTINYRLGVLGEWNITELNRAAESGFEPLWKNITGSPSMADWLETLYILYTIFAGWHWLGLKGLICMVDKQWYQRERQKHKLHSRAQDRRVSVICTGFLPVSSALELSIFETNLKRDGDIFVTTHNL